MSLKKKDYYGKEITDAIKQACDDLNESQENLEIEVVETGSVGIFGLRRKKAHIRAAVRQEVKLEKPQKVTAAPLPPEKQEKKIPASDTSPQTVDKSIVSATENQKDPVEDVPENCLAVEEGAEVNGEEAGEASPEASEIVKSELANLLTLLKIPSQIDIEIHGLTVHCTVRGEHEEELTGQEGKILDSLQYLLRKIVAKKTTERLRIAIDVGEFRQRRIEDLKEKALELAVLVKEDGKTQMIPALNPSERRVVHMVLQEDKEIRSRSVGDGLFKKILIYKPGKGNKTVPKKRPSSRGRKPKTPQATQEGEE